METSTYFRLLDISGFVIEGIVITWFCYYLWKRNKGHEEKAKNISLIINDDDLDVDTSSTGL